MVFSVLNLSYNTMPIRLTFDLLIQIGIVSEQASYAAVKLAKKHKQLLDNCATSRCKTACKRSVRVVQLHARSCSGCEISVIGRRNKRAQGEEQKDEVNNHNCVYGCEGIMTGSGVAVLLNYRTVMVSNYDAHSPQRLFCPNCQLERFRCYHMHKLRIFCRWILCLLIDADSGFFILDKLSNNVYNTINCKNQQKLDFVSLSTAVGGQFRTLSNFEHDAFFIEL